MASWRIVCVKRGTVYHPPHTHITSIGTGEQANWADMRWTLEQVLEAMADRDTFYTQSEATDKITPVETYECPHCGATHLRSAEGSVADNDLGGMRNCIFKTEMPADFSDS
jgi:hypothetical protein